LQKNNNLVDPEALEATRGFLQGYVIPGAAPVIRAIEAGKRTTQSIDNYFVKSV
jgi:NADPH-dependent glutamate synthase beta subunit-like oxidoreductase